MHYWTPDGRQVLYGTGGLWCVNAGHCREPITQAIAQAAVAAPGQWQVWYQYSALGALVFVVLIFGMIGRWSPKRARADQAAHEALGARERGA